MAAAGEREFSSLLASVKEPPLWCGVLEADETYRFLWWRAFNDPIVIRVERLGDHRRLRAIEVSMHDRTKIVRSVDRDLTPAEWAELKTTTERLGFWRMATLDIRPTEDGNKVEIAPPPMDGSYWTFEGRRAGDYHLVSRFMGGSVRELGQTFIQLAKFDIPPELIY